MATKITLSNYSIFFTDHFSELQKFLDRGKYSSVFILVDENTKKFCLPELLKEVKELKKAKILQIKSGEQNKNLRTCEMLWKQLMNQNADRHSLLINLGGGVIGDMGGFVASAYMRGIDFIQIPTTLLAMVDASIGGKTGIDFLHAKNMIGSFTDPRAVFIHHDFLKTLPQRQLRSGMAEILKHALIADKNLWEQLKKIIGFQVPPKAPPLEKIIPLIPRSIKIKKQIVEADPLESGKRKLLNHGHTVGHAIESYFLMKNRNILHGEAVAAGLIAEASISQRAGICKTNILTEIMVYTYSVAGAVPIYKQQVSPIIRLMQQDKKTVNGKLNLTLLKNIGQAVFDQQVDEEFVRQGLEIYAEHS